MFLAKRGHSRRYAWHGQDPGSALVVVFVARAIDEARELTRLKMKLELDTEHTSSTARERADSFEVPPAIACSAGEWLNVPTVQPGDA